MENEKIVPPKITMPMRHEIGPEQALQEFPEAGRRIYLVISHASPSPPPPAANAVEAKYGFARGCKRSITGAVSFRAPLIPSSLGWLGRPSPSIGSGSTESRPADCFVRSR